MYIESANNERVRSWSHLKSKKGRLKHGRFIVEGQRVVEELLASSYGLEALLWDVSSDILDSHFLDHPKLRERVFELSPAAFAAVSDTSTSQGVIAIAQIPAPSASQSLPARALLLDGVQDPGNVGTILRSSNAFGFSAICCGSNTVDPFGPKVVRSAMGGTFHLQISTESSLDFVTRWRDQHPLGRVVVATADATEICYSSDLRDDLLLVVGGEAFGASPEVQALADLEVSIPMGVETESLNVAVATSILLYEAYRQIRG